MSSAASERSPAKAGRSTGPPGAPVVRRARHGLSRPRTGVAERTFARPPPHFPRQASPCVGSLEPGLFDHVLFDFRPDVLRARRGGYRYARHIERGEAKAVSVRRVALGRLGTVVTGVSEIVLRHAQFVPFRPRLDAFGQVLAVGRKIEQAPVLEGAARSIGIIEKKREAAGVFGNTVPTQRRRDVPVSAGVFFGKCLAIGKGRARQHKGHGRVSFVRVHGPVRGPAKTGVPGRDSPGWRDVAPPRRSLPGPKPARPDHPSNRTGRDLVPLETAGAMRRRIQPLLPAAFALTGHPSRFGHRRSHSSPFQIVTRRMSCALIETTTVLALMKSAPTAGDSTTPQGARTPAASGRAMTL